jgi:chloramphenicol-sensitive protein RarD|tara:strand:+ start:261 stop:1142 length:882 start_codon:yes stop_codon:yes gene_type:complete
MRRGLLYILASQLMWGVSPAFWRGVAAIPAVDVLAHRAFWTFVVVSVVHLARRSWQQVREAALSPRILGLEALAGVLIGSNWLVWVWAVNNERVLEGSLGYFITPLVSIVLGVVVVGERLRRGQWAAVSFGVASVVWLTVDMGRLPWVSLFLAATFGSYGLIKKMVDMPPLDMLAIELSVMLPVTLGFLAFRTAGGHEALVSATPVEAMVLVASGAFTAIPLLFFAGGVRRVPLAVIGVLQYLSPSINFLLGVLAFGEAFGASRLVGFVLAWTGLVVFTMDGIRSARPPRRRI